MNIIPFGLDYVEILPFYFPPKAAKFLLIITIRSFGEGRSGDSLTGDLLILIGVLLNPL